MIDVKEGRGPGRLYTAVAAITVAAAIAGFDGSTHKRAADITSAELQTRASDIEVPDESFDVVPMSVEFTSFASPSGNIECVITRSGDSETVPRSVRCDIAERTWTPPPQPADCRLDYGHAVAISVGGPARFLCAGDTTLGSGGEPLPYGETIAAGVLRCESTPTGISCSDTESGKGFIISRGEYRFF